MLDYIIDFIINNFSKPVDTIFLFKKGFIICCLVKFVSEISRGNWSYLDNNKFIRYKLDLNFKRQKFIRNILFSSFSYKIINITYFISLIKYLFDLNSLFCITVIFLFLIYQNMIVFKFHTCFFCLISFVLFLDNLFTINTSYEKIWFIPAMITSITTSLYFFSALRKLFVKEFTSGFSLGITLKHLSKEGSKRIYKFDNVIGSMVKNKNFKLINSFHIQVVSIITIIIEIILPMMLYFNIFKMAAIIIGITMHIFFTLLEPRTLTHFSLLTILTYLLY